MKVPHDKFCVLPWISLETSPIGTVRPCCLADDEIVDDHGQKFDLNTAHFKDIQNSSYMQNLRQEFLNAQTPKTCRKCWKEERSGRTSKRMHTLDRLKHMLPDQPWTQHAKPLMFLDLKLGNICNLKCRICGSWSSSTFATEELSQLPDQEKKTSFHYQMLKQGAWPRENNLFWSQIDSVVDQLRYIEFTGGEPFMIREHFNMLQGLVDRNIAGNIEIHYNTNGTQWPEHAENVWKNFKTVEIAFSIDDIGSRFEYQRSNAVWQKVLDNIDRFKQLQQRYVNIQLQCCSTVNVFNVLYIDQLANWIDQQNFDFVYWNMLHDAWYFSVATMPDMVKKSCVEHLKTANIPKRYQEEFDKICNFINGGISTDGFIMKMKIADYDRRRGQNLMHVAPEFASLIGYTGP